MRLLPTQWRHTSGYLHEDVRWLLRIILVPISNCQSGGILSMKFFSALESKMIDRVLGSRLTASLARRALLF